MTKKNIFPVVATIAVVGVVLGVFSTTVLRDSNVSISTMTSEQAYANLSSKMKRIGVQEVSVNPQQLDVSEFLDAKDELPNSLEAEISGGNQLIMNYEQAQELFGIKFRRWLGIFNL